ncbi:hypothetical protein HYU13_03310 [Candidatus Woesearchaeota archaeon]|nr:hypothetical protein [Candidatus Woesearchaeota archaeon]
MLLLKSVKRTVSLIRKNKAKVIGLIFLQLLFFSAIAVILFFTLIPATEEGRKAIGVFDAVRASDAVQMPLSKEDAYIVFQSYKKASSYLKNAAVGIAATFLVMNGLLWVISAKLILGLKKWKGFQLALKLAFISIVSLFLVYNSIAGNLRSSMVLIDQGSFLPLVIAVLAISLIAYLTIISFSLAPYPLRSFPRQFWKTALQKAHQLIPVFLSAALITLSSIYLVILTEEANILISLLPFFFLAGFFVAVRLVMLEMVHAIITTGRKE